MVNQYEQIKSVLKQASNLTNVNKVLLKKFYSRLDEGRLIRDENLQDHFSTFFLPIVLKSNKVFIGDHIKSGSWLVPGGHIDQGESPEQTVIREIKEELDSDVSIKDIQFFDISITDINNKHPCKRHYDLWYMYPVKHEIKFDATKDEYYKTQWVSISQAINLTKSHAVREVLIQLDSSLCSK